MSVPVQLILLLGVLAAASNILGGVLALLRPRPSERAISDGLAFSGGFLLAVALLHIVPECLRRSPSAPYLIVAGYFLVFLAEHLFAGHAHHGHAEPHGAHPLVGAHLDEPRHGHIRIAAAWSAAGGLLLHSFFDGAAIAAAIASRPSMGWWTFFAVVLHKIPEGFSLSAILLGTSLPSATALWLTGALGISALLGTMLTAAAIHAGGGWEGPLLSVAAGMFLHIAATDLLPTTARVRGLRVMGMTIAGAGVVAVVSLLLPGAG